MTKKERLSEILRLLDEHYGTDVRCYLNYETPWQLLVATILSAQCTDERVNMVTPLLFAKYPTMQALAESDLQELETDVKSTGFFRNKAKNIRLAMQQLLSEHGGIMPSTIEELTALAGVGRKTANVIRCHIFGIPSVIVDTHVKRVSTRWGLTKSADPDKIEQDLMKVLPKDHWMRYNFQVIAHGRAICKAPNPKCEICFMTHVCPYYKNYL